MRLTITATRTGLHLDWGRYHDDPAPERETQLDALVERADPHPEPDRPIGFRRNEEDQ